MNFTREPIIETVISSKEGYKLLLRSSKVSGQEEYSVDAVEVVSFGHSFFFRSLERSKPFLVPVSDYEIVEVKEVRVALKSASFEKAIKIGGGKDGQKAAKEQERNSEEEGGEVAASSEGRSDKKKDKRRGRRRGRGGNTSPVGNPQEEVIVTSTEMGEGSSFQEEKPALVAEFKEEIPVAPAHVVPRNRLIPPPPQLISDKMFKERKEQLAQAAESQAAATAAAEKLFYPEEKTPQQEEASDSFAKQFEEPVDSSVEFSPLRDEGLHFERSALASPQEESTFSTLKEMLSSSFGKFW